MGHASASGTAAVVLGYYLSITVIATSTGVGRVTTGCTAPTMVGATSVVHSPIHHAVGNGIAVVTGCSATFEDAP